MKYLGLKWQERKKNPSQPKDEHPLLAELKRESAEQRRSQKLTAIRTKLMTGRRLLPEEMAWLRKNAPEEHAKAEQTERERALYKQELMLCRSKEDAENLRRRKLMEFSAEAKAIADNPNIPLEKKQEKLEMIVMRRAGILAEHADFRNTANYTLLPEKSDKPKDVRDEAGENSGGRPRAHRRFLRRSH
jgi:hypothetical protein